MGSKQRLCKDTDYETVFRCVGGIGILREEIWVDANEEVVRYNLLRISAASSVLSGQWQGAWVR